MYRETKRVKACRIMREAKERKRLDNAEPREYWEPPELRRVVEITDYDGGGNPVIYRMELRRSNRIDCYDCYINGELWKRRIGWSRVQEWIRKAFPRVRAQI